MLFDSNSPILTPGGDIRYERYAEQAKNLHPLLEQMKNLNFALSLPTPEERKHTKLRPKPGVRRRSQGPRRRDDSEAASQFLTDEDDQIVKLVCGGQIKCHSLEKTLGDCNRAVKIRRDVLACEQSRDGTSAGDMTALLKLSYESFDWSRIVNNCCENPVGYVAVPVGMAGPLLIDGSIHQIPMATTEGALVASTCRGCKAINAAGGAATILTTNGITRAPCVRFPTASQAGSAKKWLDSESGLSMMAKAFDSTSRFARLQRLTNSVAGPYLYIRFVATTGDAMGMNMISKGVERALEAMSSKDEFADMKVICLSSNLCTDKKPSAINWIEGRGKGVISEALIPPEIVSSVLKTSVESLIELNMAKNLIGSAMAGSIGGQNAHAANIVAAIFLATGQDMAQVVESSNCMTIMREVGGSLHISVSMPSIEVGTVGGGTSLVSQSAMLDVLGVGSKTALEPGENACRLARIIGAATLAGELSLCSALASGSLVSAHMGLNRKASNEIAHGGETT